MAAVRDDTGDPDGETVDDWISPDERELGEWEAQSVPLTVPTSYRDEFETLRKHVTSELEAIEDDELIQEIEILKLLSDSDAIAETRTAETTETASHPDNCPNCGEDITGYGPDPHLCPHCGVKVS
jgi:hypothetical protein